MFQTVPILLGQYRSLDSFLHRLDARSKLIPVLVVMIVGMLSHSSLFFVVALALMMAGLLLSGVSAKVLARSLSPLILLIGITFLYHIVFTDRDSEPLFDVLGFKVTTGGLSKGAFYSLRLFLFVAMSFLVTLTTSPSELAEALTKLLRPLEKIGVPVGQLGLILFVAIRFIPVLYEEFMTIYNAQVIRGVDFSGGIVKRLRTSSTIIIPVLVAAINRADDLALAMEARGYKGNRPRTFYSHSRFGLVAWGFMLASSGLVVVLLMVIG